MTSGHPNGLTARSQPDSSGARRGEAARHGGDAGRRGPLRRADDGHHVGRAGRARPSATAGCGTTSSAKASSTRRRERRQHQAHVGRQVREHHRVDEAEARSRAAPPRRYETRRAQPWRRRSPRSSQPTGRSARYSQNASSALHDEAPAEGVDREQGGELVDPLAARGRAATVGCRRRLDRRRETAIEPERAAARARRRATNRSCERRRRRRRPARASRRRRRRAPPARRPTRPTKL